MIKTCFGVDSLGVRGGTTIIWENACGYRNSTEINEMTALLCSMKGYVEQ